jgi:hypothetical protein
MSLTATPVSMTDILNLQAGIEGFTNAAEATAEVAVINAGTDTVAAYATRLEAANTANSEAVMATVSLMEGGTPTAGKLLSPTSTANEFQHLIVDYLPAQQAFAVANGLNITLYNAEVIGLGIGAGGDGTQNNFLKNFGSPTLTLSQFESTLSGQTNVSLAAIDAQYQFFLKLYGAAPANLPHGYPNADAAARAVTFGFAVGTDLANPTLNPTLISQIENAKVLNAETINGDVSGAAGYQNNVALGLQPTALPLQGTIFTNTNVFLTTGVDNATQGFSLNASGTPSLNGFVAKVSNTTFNATFGGTGATWTAGDQVTAAAGTTGQVFNITGNGPIGNINVTNLPTNKVSGIETVNINANIFAGALNTESVTGDFTSTGPMGDWVGLLTLNVNSGDNVVGGADNLKVDDTTAVNVVDTTLGTNVGQTLTVTGGSVITIAENNFGENEGGITVNGGAGTTSVSITQTELFSGDHGTVTITDAGFATKAAGTITTVVLDGLTTEFMGPANIINDNALATLTVAHSDDAFSGKTLSDFVTVPASPILTMI